jgi:DNA invertase Pin-like site-specific DNA recombinase
MPRPYGQKFLIALEKSEPETLGLQLAKLCVKANLPATAVAAALEVSGTTVYKWFRGQGVREHKRKAVEVFIDLLKEDFANGILPAKDSKAAISYIESMIGRPIQ